MTPERWNQIDELAQAALERAGNERAGFLDEACAGDDSLRREVESQIAYQQQASRFLEDPAFKHAADLMADPQAETESMEGQTVSHYRILRKLGAGGMGEVYLAKDTKLDRKVAIKFLSQNSSAGEQARKRLVREARAAAALDHPHICAVHEVCEESAYSFIVMQYVEGENLAERMKREPLGIRNVLNIAVQIADALMEAHGRGIIHRDIKPANIMLSGRSQVKVLDFGLARVLRRAAIADSKAETSSHLSASGAIVGTVPYMSPEQVRGEESDQRSDIFSLGVMLYEMTAGCHPFERDTRNEVIAAILEREPPALQKYSSEAPRELERIIGKAMRKDREERYQNVTDLLTDLKDLRQEIESEAKIDRSIHPHAGSDPRVKAASRAKILRSRIKRHKLSVSIALAVLVGTAVAAFLYFSRPPVSTLTDKDMILLTDFVNTTGDAVFDGITLKQALAVQLEQSPFLKMFPEEKVRETLRSMNRSPDEAVTREIALEICQRQGIKALIAGTIARLERNYAITLETDNAQTGEAIARQVVEAEGKDQVLKVLGRAATEMRERLGESLNSIQKFDAPIEQATTSSLEALKAFSQAMQYQRQAKYLEAIQFHQRAIEVDPSFALAYARLSSAYGNTRQQEQTIKTAEKAFELRERVSAREKFYISWLYHWNVTRDFDEQNRVAELWKTAYPREAIPFVLRGINYNLIGQHEKAIEEYREAIRLDPNSAQTPHNLATSFLILNRFEEAKQPSKIPAGPSLLYQIAFVEGDLAEMKRLIDVMISRGNEHIALHWQARVAAFSGRLREAQELTRRSLDLSQRRNSQGEVDTHASGFALLAATVGQCQRAREALSRISALPQNLYTFFNAGMALALCGEVKQAQSMIDERVRQYPKDRVANEVLVPLIQAAIEIQRGHRTQAIPILEDASRYKGAADYAGVSQSYLLGQAYLGERRCAEAAVEFQYILDHRGQDPTSPLYPLAHVGLARAYALQGDSGNARKAYGDFFAVWKDADGDLPILIESRKEYARLK